MILDLLLRVQAEPSASPSNFSFLFVLVGWAVIAYFFFIRPGRVRDRRHKERINQLRKGDEVITAGGIVGKVVHLADERITIKSDESRLVLIRSRITDIVGDKDDKKEKQD